MDRNGQAIGFRLVYRNLVLKGSLTTVFRPDLPKYQRLFRAGSVVAGRVIAEPGNSGKKMEPVFTEDRISLRIRSIKRLALHKLTAKDFVGSSPDVRNIQALVYHLGLIYNRPADDFTMLTKVIKIEFEYLKPEEGL